MGETKTCSKCGETKPMEEFHRKRSANDGRRSECKECVAVYSAAYYARPKVKARKSAYRNDLENKARQAIYDAAYYAKPENKARIAANGANYRAKPENKAHRANYTAAYYAKPENRARQNDHAADYRADIENKIKIKSRNVINAQVQSGNLPRIGSVKCEECGRKAQSYHHYLGYHPSHWLDVVPLCGRCHYKAHQEMDVIEDDSADAA